MLGKLITYELKESYKLHSFLCLFVFATSLLFLTSIYLNINNITNSMLGIFLLFGSCILWILGMVIAGFGCILSIWMRFYKSCFSNRGYFTFTLPATGRKIFFSKFLVACFWQFMTQFIIICNIAGMVFYFYQLNILNISAFDFTSLFQDMGFTWFSLLIMGGTLLLNMASTILLGFASICIGQLSNNHKVPMAILAYVCLNSLMQIANTLITYLTEIEETSSLYTSYLILDSSIAYYFDNKSLITGGITIVFCIIFYLISHNIMNKHINLA